MEAFAYRDGGFSSSMSRGEALLLRQLASEVLVVLDDPGDFATTSSMINAATETEQGSPTRAQPAHAAALHE